MSIAAMASCTLDFLTLESRKQILDFTLKHLMPDGGFKGRAGQSDIYYTFFGVQLLSILSDGISEHIFEYIDSVKELETYDLIHLTCFLRTENLLNRLKKFPDKTRQYHLLEKFRTDTGGFCIAKNTQSSSVYASFLAYLTCLECDIQFSHDPKEIIECIKKFRAEDGSYAEIAEMETGTLTVTCAAVILLYDITGHTDETAVAWIINRQAETGGFYASENAFLPDLVSSASAVFCLNRINQKQLVNENILDFVESLMQANGGFSGNSQDFTPDVEYTFYGFLTIGSFMF